ncbi:sulfite exporter TauE/SafE family protein [Sphingobium amiense]|uniref:Probable membrane transporter protein n=1 Tax=Sphingobium amiense TaxID=135719 RepID=A0A494W287_9SPHN|nr:sulfite exporter TauE/SafE family protein [Sphingobium amiense]BBD97268.1 sulfite exporter TauE/SafE family protein [Sphingobium amiense]
MDSQTILTIALLMGLGAALYTAVGHAGASAYLAIMALFSVAPATMKPTALVLNILVATFTSFRFIRAGQFDLRLAWPFIAGAVPLAFLGGSIHLPGEAYRPLVGGVLLLAGVRLLWPRPLAKQAEIGRPPVWAALASGAGVGLLSGLTGTGGGIFLSPILLFFGWALPRQASATAAVFILCNSVAGLAGNLSSVGRLPAELPYYIAAVAVGAVIGTSLGVRRLPAGRLLQLLGVVLLIAGGKLIFT